MPRTIIDIPTSQLRDVDRLCKTLCISRAEAVRRALAAFVDQNDQVSKSAFGLWNPPSGRQRRASSEKSAQ